jgi:hypothetical protein
LQTDKGSPYQTTPVQIQGLIIDAKFCYIQQFCWRASFASFLGYIFLAFRVFQQMTFCLIAFDCAAANCVAILYGQPPIFPLVVYLYLTIDHDTHSS